MWRRTKTTNGLIKNAAAHMACSAGIGGRGERQNAWRAAYSAAACHHLAYIRLRIMAYGQLALFQVLSPGAPPAVPLTFALTNCRASPQARGATPYLSQTMLCYLVAFVRCCSGEP